MFTEHELQAAKLHKSLDLLSKKKNLPINDLTSILLTLLASVHLVNQEKSTLIRTPLRNEIKGLIYQLKRTQANEYDFYECYSKFSLAIGAGGDNKPLKHVNSVYFAVLDMVILATVKSSALELFSAAYRNFLLQRYGEYALTAQLASQLAHQLMPSARALYTSVLVDSELGRLFRMRPHADLKLSISYDVIADNDFLLRLSSLLFEIKLKPVTGKKLEFDLALIHAFNNGALDLPGPNEILDQIFVRHINFEYAVVVMDEPETNQNSISNLVRQHVIEQKLLLAVIQLGNVEKINSSNYSLFSPSIWIVKRSPSSTLDEVLFIDARALIEADQGNRGQNAMGYAAQLLDQWLAYKRINNDEIVERTIGHLSGNFIRNFRQGYRDIQNLCFAIPRKTMKLTDWSINPISYKKKSPVRDAGFPKVDSVELENRLRTNFDKGDTNASYIIGNNGAGKSALLNQLATTFRSKEFKVKGIALSSSDRFPFSKPGNLQSNGFTYFGARSTETIIDLKSNATLLNNLLKTVQTDQVRLEAFQKILGKIGFKEQLYLIPVATDSNENDPDREMLETVEGLTGSAQDNLKIYRNFRSTTSTFGLKRKNAEREIHEFIQLSSGEQQVLILAIKLGASAHKNSLILIDEPEISLHVAWQRAIPQVMEIICNDLECNVVTATHSPVVISAALELNCECYVAKNWQLHRIERNQRNSVDAVLFDSFETYTSNTRRVSEHCASVVADAIRRVNSEDHLAEDFHPILNELESADQIVRAAATVLGEIATGGDLELVKRAREAINELLESNEEN